MRSSRAILLPIFLVGALAGVNGGVCAKTPTPLGEALTILFSDKNLTREDRKSIAKGIAFGCRDLNGKIPQLSPREDDWVDAEIRAGRINAVIDSVEIAKRQSKQTMAGCERSATTLHSELPEALEIAYWSVLLGNLIDENLGDRLEVLKRSMIVTKDDIDQSGFPIFPLMSRLIAEKILTPNLMKAAGAKR